MKVKVYWNLAKRVYSVQHKGKVIAHRDTMCLMNVHFNVSEAGRRRVLKKKSKNVHAFVVGTWIEEQKYADALGFVCSDMGTEITYDPYKYETFVTKTDYSPILTASFVFMKTVDRRAKIFSFSPSDFSKIFSTETVMDYHPRGQEDDRHDIDLCHSEVSKHSPSYSVG